MTWEKSFNNPGVYRACVPRPSEDELQTGGVTGNKIDRRYMTVLQCLQNCSGMVSYTSRKLVGKVLLQASASIISHFLAILQDNLTFQINHNHDNVVN